ncbi:hypothetical protein NDU88_002057 [Pleurodeles waltl]|uniref:HMG box domain-containing protein n=1 Tax=Pleurodeles waltl TaxID=8319 RepID=A0AAV7P9R4_PLEWA|nr:hypothetical protein NDU88_002057 [Pleurodeles waltl]
MSPFSFFVQACKAEIRRRHPEARVSVAVLSRACSERWRSTTARERAMFEHLAQGDKERWERERGGAIPARARPRKDPRAPKKPLTAFFLFASSYRPQLRAECPGLSVPEQAKRLGQKWSEQSPEARRPFELRAAVLKEKYEAEVAAYQSVALGQGEPLTIGEGDKRNDVGSQDLKGSNERQQKNDIESNYSGVADEAHGIEGPHAIRPLEKGGTEKDGLETHHRRGARWELTEKNRAEARCSGSRDMEKHSAEDHCSKEVNERKHQKTTPTIEDIQELSEESEEDGVDHCVMRMGNVTELVTKQDPEVEEDRGEDDEEMEEGGLVEDGT